MQTFTVHELATFVAGTVEGDPARRISGVAPVREAGPTDLTFVIDDRYARELTVSHPGAALIPEDLRLPGYDTSFIRVPDPHGAFGRLLGLFFPERTAASGVHETGIVGHGVELGEDVCIGPFAVLGDGARIGARTVLGAHTIVDGDVVIGDDCAIADSCSIHDGARIGDRVKLHSGVRVSVDGFGYSSGPNGHTKVPQVGGCRIGDDVEIGANSTVDRGAIGDTVVGAGTKIDNLVHIGHNVRIGPQCIIVAQVGIAGSVDIGDRVQLAGQAGIAGHLSIGDGARIAAQAGVIGDVPAGASYSGYPARPHRQAMRASAALRRLPGLFRRVAALEASREAGDE